MGRYNKYVNSLRHYKQHTEFETKGLITKLKRDKNHIIEGNLRLVAKLANDMHNAWPNFDIMDLIQEGNEELIMLVEKFDPTRNVKWSTFMSYCVKNRMLTFIKNTTGAVRLYTTTSQRKVFNNLTKIRCELEEGGALEDVANKFEVDPETIVCIMGAGQETNLDNVTVDSPEDIKLEKDYKALIQKHINDFKQTLNNVERDIFVNNIYTAKETLTTIADKHGRTVQSIWNTKDNVLDKAKVFFTALDT